jgi:hypothetical protein
MEPLKPETVQGIIDLAQPAAAPAIQDDIEEYERLLSERFTRDPDLPMSPQEAEDVDGAEDRIAQLHQKLFRGPATNPPGRRATSP